MTDRAVDMGADKLEPLVELAREHDPDVAVVAVVHGAPGRGLALSFWTGEEDTDAGVALLLSALFDPEEEVP